MGLPKIDVPLYNLTLPLSKKKVKFRPFLVKEEKILLMAIESKEEKSVLDAVKQIVGNCLQGNLDINELPSVDFEFLFINIRARSVGELVEMQYKCNNTVDDAKCNHIVDVTLDLLTVKPTKSTIDPKIPLWGDVGIVLKYPTVKSFDMISENEAEAFIEVLRSNFEYIYDSESIYYSKDISREDFEEFIDNLSGLDFNKIKEFFANLPKLKTTLTFECPKCGFKKEMELEGIQNFF